MKIILAPVGPQQGGSPLPRYRPDPTEAPVASLDQPFVKGCRATPLTAVPQIDARLSWGDRFGSWLARCNIGRLSYVVDAGLYALGEAGADSPVLVTADYKMSFDRLRGALVGRVCWLLVLDTKGINVWCAAAKGTFATQELSDRIHHSRLAEVVNHGQVIVPQLGAAGVNGLAVKRQSGFEVVWGPIRAEDLPAFLDNNCLATPAMRRKDFPLAERLALVPVEVSQALGKALLLISIFMLLSGLGGELSFRVAAMEMGLFAAWAVAVALVSGTVITPLLLPWLPGRAFSLKGMWAGLFSFLFLVAGHGLLRPQRLVAPLETLAWLLMSVAISSWLAMNFTGSSTYTSRSGVRHEMRRAIPLQAASFLVGALCWLAERFW